MRYSELLLEYQQTVTVRNYGDALFDKFLRHESDTTKINILKHVHSDAQFELILNRTKLNQELIARKTEIVGAIVGIIEDADPTPNKQYVVWLIRMYIKDNHTEKLEDVASTISDYLKDFVNLNSRGIIPSPQNDINRYRSFDEFSFEVVSLRTEYKDKLKIQTDLKNSQSRVYYEDELLKVIVPFNMEAAIKYGQYVNGATGRSEPNQHTKWCTAATKANNYFQDYHDSGPLYIVFPKQPEYEGEKYQIHPATGEFMDPTNKPADSRKVFDRFPEFADTIIDDEPDLKNMIGLTDDKTLIEIFDACVRMAQVSIENIHSNDSDAEEYGSQYDVLYRALFYLYSDKVPHSTVLNQIKQKTADSRIYSVLQMSVIVRDMITIIIMKSTGNTSKDIQSQFGDLLDLIEMDVKVLVNNPDDDSQIRKITPIDSEEVGNYIVAAIVGMGNYLNRDY
jgi:hypothetical protein